MMRLNELVYLKLFKSVIDGSSACVVRRLGSDRSGADMVSSRGGHWSLVSRCTGHVNTCVSDTHQLSFNTNTVNISA